MKRWLLPVLCLIFATSAWGATCRTGEGKDRPFMALAPHGVTMEECHTYAGASFPFECSVVNKDFVYCSYADCDLDHRKNKMFGALERQTAPTGIQTKFRCGGDAMNAPDE